MARKLSAAIVCALVLAGCGGGSDGTEPTVKGPVWNHDPADATAGPAAWGKIDKSFEQCLTGNSQSPVDRRDDSLQVSRSSSSTIRRRHSS